MGKTALIVDDNHEILTILSRYLKRNGFNVFTAQKAAEAYKILYSYLPDIILSDLRMPEIDGREFIGEVSSKHPDLPIIVISGEGTMEDAIDTLTYGAWDYIIKPITDFTVLQEAIDKAIDRASKREMEKRQSRVLAEKIEVKNKALKDREEQLSNVQEELGSYLDELSRTRENLDLVVTAAELGFWTWNGLTEKVFINDQSARLLGMNQSVFSFPISYFKTILYPEDIPAAEEWINCLAGQEKKEEAEKLRKIEFRMLTGSGGSRWFEISGKVIQRRSDGSVLEAAGIFQDIHRRKEEEIRRLRAEEQLTLTLEGARIGIWELNLERNTIEINDILIDYLGVNDYILDVKSVREGYIHPDDVTKLERIYDYLLQESSERTDLEVRLKTRDGNYRWTLIRSRIIRWNESGKPARIMGITIDVSDRKKAEESLRRELEFNNRIVFTMPVMFASHTRDGTLIGSNQAFRSALSKEKRNEDNIYRLLEPVSGEKYRNMVGELPPDRRGNLTVSLDGRECSVPVAWYFTLLSRENTDDLIVGIGIDLTERIKMEMERRKQEEELSHVSRMVSLGTLASGIAHEINNPNNFISLNARNLQKIWDQFLEFLKKNDISYSNMQFGDLSFESIRSVVPKLLEGIQEGAHRIERLVKNLKNLVRYENGKKVHPVDVSAVLRSAILITDDLIKKRISDFSIDYSKSVYVSGRYYELEQVFINLITNACQAVSPEGGSLKIIIECGEEQETVKISFMDNGIGMSEEVRSKVFDPFFTTKRERGGTGLGLSVSYNILKKMGGEIHFDSEPGKGTAVTVELPSAVPN
jgi:PAS domain S-box-containing protein